MAFNWLYRYDRSFQPTQNSNTSKFKPNTNILEQRLSSQYFNSQMHNNMSVSWGPKPRMNAMFDATSLTSSPSIAYVNNATGFLPTPTYPPSYSPMIPNQTYGSVLYPSSFHSRPSPHSSQEHC